MEIDKYGRLINPDYDRPVSPPSRSSTGNISWYIVIWHFFLGALIGLGIGIVVGCALGIVAAIVSGIMHGHDYYSNPTIGISVVASMVISAIRKSVIRYNKDRYPDNASSIVLIILVVVSLVTGSIGVYNFYKLFSHNYSSSPTPASSSTTVDTTVVDTTKKYNISVFTHGIINETDSSAVAGVDVNGNTNEISIIERGVCYSTHDNPTIDDVIVIDDGSTNCTLTGLSSNTTYYVKAYAKISNGIGLLYGDVQSFTTKEKVVIQTTTTNQGVAFCTINKDWQEHNILVNGQKGMRIHINLDVVNMLNTKGRFVAYFYSEDGEALKDQNNLYKTDDGHISTHVDFKPSYQNANYADLSVFIPYDELHISEAGHYNLQARLRIVKFNENQNAEFIDNGNYKIHFYYDMNSE